MDGGGATTGAQAVDRAASLLVHVLDVAPLDGSDPDENYETVEGELRVTGGLPMPKGESRLSSPASSTER